MATEVPEWVYPPRPGQGGRLTISAICQRLPARPNSLNASHPGASGVVTVGLVGP